MAASSNSHTLRDLLLETHKALGVLTPSTRCFWSISNANIPVTWVGFVRTTPAGRGADWILWVIRNTNCIAQYDISDSSATVPFSPGHHCQLIPLVAWRGLGHSKVRQLWLGIGHQISAFPPGLSQYASYRGFFLFLLCAGIDIRSLAQKQADHLFSSAKQISALASAGNGLQRAQHALAQTLSLAAVMHSLMSASLLPAYSA